MAFNVYDGQGRPIQALADYELRPDRGSTNPFLPGADRMAPRRSYTAFIEFGPRPKKPARNTIYTDSKGGTFWYRVYIPDSGRDEKGGVPLPRLTYEGPLALPSADACRELQAPYLNELSALIANAPGLPNPTLDGSRTDAIVATSVLKGLFSRTVRDGGELGAEPAWQGNGGWRA